MKQLITILLLCISVISFGATLRERINKEKITLITVLSIELAKAQAQAIVDQDEETIKKSLGFSKFPTSGKLYDISIAKFNKVFTVLIPKGLKKSFSQFERPIQFNQSTVFILDTVDLDKNVGFTTFSVSPDKEMVKKLIEEHNKKFLKQKEEKKDLNKNNNKNNNNPFGVFK